MWLHPGNGRLWKFTMPGKAGLTFVANQVEGNVIVTEADATPLEYLERLILQRDIFGVPTWLELLVIHKGRPRIHYAAIC